MAMVTTHLLNSVTGEHAVGVRTVLYRIDTADPRTVLFSAVTNADGRLRENVAVTGSGKVTCELVVQLAEYFAAYSVKGGDMRILREAVVRFDMPDPEGAYHIPMMLAPNSYSIWCSS